MKFATSSSDQYSVILITSIFTSVWFLTTIVTVVLYCGIKEECGSQDGYEVKTEVKEVKKM